MGHALQITEPAVFEREDCCNCGVAFFVPQDLQRRAKATGRSFYCPNGHGQHYTKSEADKLRAKLQEQTRIATQQAERARIAEVANASLRTENGNLKKRIKNGVCPCCTRSFQNLKRHIATKHPEYAQGCDLAR